MSRFQILGGYLAWGLAAPGALRSVVKQVALQGLGGPTQAVMLLGWDRRACRELVPHLLTWCVFALRDALHQVIRKKHNLPSFNAIADTCYCVVGLYT